MRSVMRRCGNKPRSDWSQREPIHLRQLACAKLRGGLSGEGIARSSAEHHLSAPERRLSRFAEAHPRQTRKLIRDRRRVTACPRPKFRRCRSCPQLRAHLSGKTATAQIKGLAEHGKFCAQRIVSTGDKPPPYGLYKPFLHNLQFTLAQRYLFRSHARNSLGSVCVGFSFFPGRDGPGNAWRVGGCGAAPGRPGAGHGLHDDPDHQPYERRHGEHRDAAGLLWASSRGTWPLCQRAEVSHRTPDAFHGRVGLRLVADNWPWMLRPYLKANTWQDFAGSDRTSTMTSPRS